MVLGKPQTDPTLEWFLSHCHIHKYPSKSTLIHAGEKAETLYYIVKGSVAVLIKDEEGKEMILSYLNQGDFIGELGHVFGGRMEHNIGRCIALLDDPVFHDGNSVSEAQSLIKIMSNK